MTYHELIAQVEAENRNNSINVYRREKGKRLLESLMQEKAKKKPENKAIARLKINLFALNQQMLKRIWQRLVRCFRRWFGVDKRRNTTSQTVDHKPPTPLTDTDYEFLFIELLEGVARGWQQARVLRFFEVLSERGKQELWVAWLRRFGKKLLASPVANDELAARMVQLGELGCGEITEVAYEIGMQLLIKPTETHWENTPVDGEDEREGEFSSS